MAASALTVLRALWERCRAGAASRAVLAVWRKLSKAAPALPAGASGAAFTESLFRVTRKVLLSRSLSAAEAAAVLESAGAVSAKAAGWAAYLEVV